MSVLEKSIEVLWKFDDIFADVGTTEHRENRVRYLCLNGVQGRAIVEGTKAYEVAVLLQLRETLEVIEKDYAARWDDYFAIVSKPMFYTFAVDANPKAVLNLS